jgi:hypothetical protein
MNAQKKQIATSLIMLGMLSMIFSVLAFAEKTREDGHLPEQNGRGSGELTAFAVAAGLAGFLVPVLASGGRAGSGHGHHTLSSSAGMRCLSRPSFFHR